MHTIAFLKGIALALIISVPLGPMALLCIKRSYRDGFWAGWATTIGIALGDMLFALVAGFGLSYITDLIHTYEKPIKLLGLLFLLMFGVYTMFTKLHSAKPHEHHASFIKSFYTAFFLTLSNILSLLGVIALVSWLTAAKLYGNVDTTLLAVGVFVGVFAWFTLINIVVHFFKERISTTTLNTINYVIGMSISIVALALLARLFLWA